MNSIYKAGGFDRHQGEHFKNCAYVLIEKPEINKAKYRYYSESFTNRDSYLNQSPLALKLDSHFKSESQPISLEYSQLDRPNKRKKHSLASNALNFNPNNKSRSKKSLILSSSDTEVKVTRNKSLPGNYPTKKIKIKLPANNRNTIHALPIIKPSKKLNIRESVKSFNNSIAVESRKSMNYKIDPVEPHNSVIDLSEPKNDLQATPTNELNNELTDCFENMNINQQTLQDNSKIVESNSWGEVSTTEWPPAFSENWNQVSNESPSAQKNNDWPNMRTDVATDENHNIIRLNSNSDNLPKIKQKPSQIPKLIDDFITKQQQPVNNTLGFNEYLLQKETINSNLKKNTPLSREDLENWSIISEAISAWLPACSNFQSRKLVTSTFSSHDYYINSERQFVIASTEGSLNKYIAVDWVSLNLTRQRLELETGDTFLVLPHKLMSSVEIIKFYQPKDYYVAKKRIQKHNKNIQKQEKSKSILRQIIFEWHRLQKVEKLKSHAYLAFDCEMWERNHDYLTEIGWAIYDNNKKKYLSRHYIIAEHFYLENSRYVGDHRDKFLFGNSIVAPLEIALQCLVKDIASVSPVIIIGHDISMDLKILLKHGIDFSQNSLFVKKFDQVTNSKNSFSIVDTSTLFMARICSINQAPSLTAVLKYYNITVTFPHNAGNDAVYTLFGFLKLVRDEIPSFLGKPSSALLADDSNILITRDRLLIKTQNNLNTENKKSVGIYDSNNKSDNDSDQNSLIDYYNTETNNQSKVESKQKHSFKSSLSSIKPKFNSNKAELTAENLRSIPAFKREKSKNNENVVNISDELDFFKESSTQAISPNPKTVVLKAENIKELDLLLGFEY
ncbi:hypothetical protein BB561_003880 [Smittium simulii]|uniref:Gfd2/YDR514C-like C-terminal domain-containing protein n=1 Tax=Smittium simulii TaxID=133385 RepID=A0A2T9YJ73_9FUNG|nr:hypothetical protein BB561_003880 [Smittium simulii]